jgi:N-acyl-L-homoserine lactone synthetase
MQNGQQVLRADEAPRGPSIFTGLLRGYRFRVCGSLESAARALAVRRKVYVGECGYDVPVPDEYDLRSWLLVAEQAATGEVVGSMRVTPRAGGPLEAEEYFDLPRYLVSPSVVEVTRFAILPSARPSGRFLPVVAMGLFKLVCNFVKRLDAQYVVVCAKAERVWTYQWLRFEPTGRTAAYGKLGNAPHELLVCDLRGGIARHRSHRYWEFFFETEHPEVVLPERIPEPGLGETPRIRPVAHRRMAEPCR